MPDDPILQFLIAQPGQSQDERLPGELDVHYVDVDERDAGRLLAYAQKLAKTIPYVDTQERRHVNGWEPLFKLSATGDGSTKASRALFEAFLGMYEYPRAKINEITGKHLDFFYRRVLRFESKPAVPDRGHVVLSLKKGSAPVKVEPSHMFYAGKDATGAEVLYSPTAESIVNLAKIASLRSVFVDHSSRGRLLFAPIANSADGLGTALPEDSPTWRPFGHAALPAAEIGFAIAAPILRLQEGKRTIDVSIAVSPTTGLSSAMLAGAFQAYLTGEKQWLGPYDAAVTVASDRMELRIELPDGDPAVVDYDPKVHFHSYTADAPVLQLIFKPSTAVGYDDLKVLSVASARITVDVEGVKSLKLESDLGTLDAKKAFLPFGAQPVRGSRFLIGYDEALGKTLSRLDVTLEWKGAPANLATQYAHYSPSVDNASFTVSTSVRDASTTHTRTSAPLFETDATAPIVVNLISATVSQPAHTSSSTSYVYALMLLGTTWGQSAADQQVLQKKVTQSPAGTPPTAQRGVITMTLDGSFLHQEYREQSIQKILAKLKADATATTDDDTVVLLKEPYTPTVQNISLGYTAKTADVAISSVAAADFAQLDVQFFHIGPFGQMREHGHQRNALGFTGTTSVPLLPQTDGDGELLIGLQGLNPGDSISILLQVAEGSANPDAPAQKPEWFVLSNNYWKKLGTFDVVRDTTNRLLASGVVGVAVPTDATTANTIMPAGWIWLKATIATDPASTSQLVDVIANAIEVQFVMTSADAAAAHLATSHAKGTIAKLKTPIAAVTKVAQPYPTFGGAPRESDVALRTRAAERLRHRHRAVTSWDYERLVLEAFPSVQRVKCIQHAKPGSWMAPGHVLVVVVPQARTATLPDPLQPKVDADTIVRITDYLNAKNSGSAHVTVQNPVYQQIRVSCRVKFRTGYEFNFYSTQVQLALTQFLSPWAFNVGSPISFGGRVYRSVLLDFVEELSYVDYVTDFKMSTFVSPATTGPDVDHVQAATPDAVLVSAATHDIGEAE